MSKQIVLGPPFGEFVDPDEDYVRGQGGQLGSGVLGGWSQANLGGFFELEAPSSGEIREEIRKLVGRNDRRWPAQSASSGRARLGG